VLLSGPDPDLRDESTPLHPGIGKPTATHGQLAKASSPDSTVDPEIPHPLGTAGNPGVEDEAQSRLAGDADEPTSAPRSPSASMA